MRTSTLVGQAHPPGTEHWRAVCLESDQHGSGRGRRKRTPTTGTSPAAYFTRREAARKRPEPTTREPGPRRAAHPVHESVNTTQIYLHADLTLKQQALDKTTPPTSTPGRYQPPDQLIAFLEGL